MMKYGLSPIASYYFVSVLLTNCHTCYFNSKAAISFQCAPPNVWQYFGLTDEEREELDLYLELVLQQPASEAAEA